MSQGIDPRVRYVFLLTFLALAAWLPALAYAGSSPAGEWEGKMKTPDDEEVAILLTITKDDADWSGSLESDAIGPTSVTDLKVTDTRISFTFQPEGAPFPAHFSGSYIAGDDRVTGTFSLRGNSRFVKFQRVPGSEEVPLAEGEEPREPARIRHDHTLALSARANYWAALHVTKDEKIKINTLTDNDVNFDAALNWFVVDEFDLFVRAFRGGQKFGGDEAEMESFASIGLSEDSYLKLDGFEVGVRGYLGDVMMRKSNFNPYLTATGGIVQWELTEGSRGSDPVVVEQNALEGDAGSFSFGIGAEYEIGRSLDIEFEWAWRYMMTGDETKWPDSETTWSNTHSWVVSLGVMFGFM
jgi:hypothetical protein